MKVKELIEKLQTFDPNVIVIVRGCEDCGWWVPEPQLDEVLQVEL